MEKLHLPVESTFKYFHSIESRTKKKTNLADKQLI